MKYVAMLTLAFALTGCTNTKTARQVLEAEGLQQIEMTGFSLWGCSDKDTFHDGFRGVRNGKKVEGVVCSGLLKGATVRYTMVRP